MTVPLMIDLFVSTTTRRRRCFLLVASPTKMPTNAHYLKGASFSFFFSSTIPSQYTQQCYDY